jgi:polyphosphate glucokinase
MRAVGDRHPVRPYDAAVPTTPRRKPKTLAIEIGGTGLKAAVLDPAGHELTDRVRVDTTYPMPPSAMVAALRDLTSPLAPYDRVSVGFPGVVRNGRIRTAPHFVTKRGPGTKVDPELVEQWREFDLTSALSEALGAPVRVANDADLQGMAVVRGEGVELVVTLGTGVGTAIFDGGKLAPHLELAHHPFRHDQTYNEQLGEAARKKVGGRRWNRRVEQAVAQLRALVQFDHLYIGGGNSSRVRFDLASDTELVDNEAGILGGIRLWDEAPT